MKSTGNSTMSELFRGSTDIDGVYVFHVSVKSPNKFWVRQQHVDF